MPTDAKLKTQLLQNAHLSNKYVFINSIDVIKLSFLYGLALSLIYCVLTQCFPKHMNKFAVLASLLVILAFTILVLLYNSSPAFAVYKYVVMGILLFLFIVLLANFIKYRKAFELQAIFLNEATKMLSKRKLTFAYIPLFILIFVAFVILLVLEFGAFWGGGHLEFNAQKSVFYEFHATGSIIATVFIAIQALWGLSFIKEACINLKLSQLTSVFLEMLSLITTRMIGAVLLLSRHSSANIQAVSSEVHS